VGDGPQVIRMVGESAETVGAGVGGQAGGAWPSHPAVLSRTQLAPRQMLAVPASVTRMEAVRDVWRMRRERRIFIMR